MIVFTPHSLISKGVNCGQQIMLFIKPCTIFSLLLNIWVIINRSNSLKSPPTYLPTAFISCLNLNLNNWLAVYGIKRHKSCVVLREESIAFERRTAASASQIYPIHGNASHINAGQTES